MQTTPGRAAAPKRSNNRRKPQPRVGLTQLIRDLLDRHNLPDRTFAVDYCEMKNATLNGLLTGRVEDPRLKTIVLLVNGVLRLEPSYPIERIYEAFDLPTPRLHAAMQPAPRQAIADADLVTVLRSRIAALPVPEAAQRELLLLMQDCLDQLAQAAPGAATHQSEPEYRAAQTNI